MPLAAGPGMTRAMNRRAVAILGLFSLGCGASPTGHREPLVEREDARTLWVVAPHPDDEVLMAGQALLDAVAEHRPHEVVIVTNGDFTCERNGWARQLESIAALASIGVTEEHVHFLGYPDGWLSELGETPLPAIPRTAADGSCGAGTGTYGARGAERGDVHTARTGSAGEYTASSVVGDLVALFEASPPAEIHLPHAIDTHPDHAMTYAYVRRALDVASLPSLPTLVRHVVHAPGASCWPSIDATDTCRPSSPEHDGSPMPPLPGALAVYAPDRVLEADPARRRAAIGHYVSQLEAPLETSWLASFARTTEPSWHQTLERIDGRARVITLREEDAVSLAAPGSEASVAGVTVRWALSGATHTLTLLRASDALVIDGTAIPPRTGPLALRIAIGTLDGVEGREVEVHGPDGMIFGAVWVDADR